MKTFQSFLKSEFDARRKNIRYSIRAFSRDLDLDSSTLSKILAGTRKPSKSLILKVLQKLGYSQKKIRSLEKSFTIASEIGSRSDQDYSSWGASQFRSSWLHYATLSAFELKDFKSETSWFAGRLAVSLKEMEKILDDLEKQGSISRSEVPWKLTLQSSLSSRGSRSEALLLAHRSCIQRGLKYLEDPNKVETLYGFGENDDQDLAAFCGSTFSIDVSALPLAMHFITEFRRSLANFLGGGDSQQKNDEVYRLNIQLFPLSEPYDN